MKVAVHDSDVIKMKDQKNVHFRSSRSGHLPDDILDDLEVYVAENLADFLRAGDYYWSKVSTSQNQRVLTEMFEHSLDMMQADFPEKIRYTHVELRGPHSWALHVHLEEASAPCIIKVQAEVEEVGAALKAR